VSTFSAQAFVANPERPRRRVGGAPLVGSGVLCTLLPGEVVSHLELRAPRRRTAMLARGKAVPLPRVLV
jgi:hypothetical protein